MMKLSLARWDVPQKLSRRRWLARRFWMLDNKGNISGKFEDSA